jgi:hypothetical protein
LLLNDQNTNEDKLGAWTFIVAEVKKSEKPWILFRQAPRHSPIDLLLERPRLVHLFQGANRGLMERELSESIEYNSVARECGWVGYGIHESFKKPSDKSRWYSSCNKVLNAAKYQLELEKPDENRKVSNKQKMHKWYRYVQVRPLIILDGPLISARLLEDGNPVLEEINMASLDFPSAPNEVLPSKYRVDIVTLSTLFKYLERCRDRLTLIAEDLQRIAQSQKEID